MLARNLPLKVIHRHSDNPFRIEALVFGQAGMLDPSTRIFDEYYQQLCREYFFLLRKYENQADAAVVVEVCAHASAEFFRIAASRFFASPSKAASP